MEQKNTLAIVGSPGSGKTTLAVKLALELARRKKNVVVVCADPFVPCLPFLLPLGYEQEVSLGALLTAPVLTQEKLLKACVPVEENPYLSFLGYKFGENLMSYPKVTREKAVEFLVCLRHLADYAILDCSSIVEADVFSILALEMADGILQVGTSNLRGISYYQSHAGILSTGRERNKVVSAIGNFKTGQEWEAAASQYGGVDFVFPYVAELEKQYDAASLFLPLVEKEADVFQQEIKKLMRQVFGLSDPKPEKQEEAAERKKLVVRSPFVWTKKGEF
ncbi:MAG: zeta toxin family protein [Lachnospiraceae bacterium]|nr:zeta toxin family protein [Lachnospiraceae bacterium]MDY3221853.1 zeta toxin family protein [Lachnospiraceae bacterium]